MFKVLVCEDEDFKFYLQETNEKIFVHLDVDNYSKDVLMRMADAFSDIKYACSLEGIKEVYAFSPNHKFCRIGGGELIDLVDWLGEEYGVYKWETM